MSESAVALLPRWTQQMWMDEANCRGRTELFFPPAGERPAARAAREGAAEQLCETCAVQTTCKSYSRNHREHGFWGGETEEERVLAGFTPPHPITRLRFRDAG